MPLRRRLAPALVFCGVLVAGPLWLEISNFDFDKAYYAAARSVFETGTFRYSYEGFKNLPLIVTLFVPFAAFGKETAGALFLGFEIAAYAASFWVATNVLATSTRDRWVLCFLFSSSVHYYTCIQIGQITVLCLLLMLLMLRAYLKSRPVETGILLSLAFALKIPVGGLFFYFLCKREGRVAVASAASTAALVAGSLVVFGWELHEAYLEAAVFANAGKTLVAYNNPTLAAFAMRLLSPPALFDWRMLALPFPLDWATLAAGLAPLVFVLILVARRGGGNAPQKRLEVAMVISACLLPFPVAWDHYFLFLLIPLFVATEGLRAGRQRWMWIGAFALVNTPVFAVMRAFVQNPAWRPGLEIVASAPLFGCLLLLWLLVVQYRGLAAPDRDARQETDTAGAPRRGPLGHAA